MLYIKDNVIKERSRIIVIKDGYQIINPTEEMVLADGWEEYVPTTPDIPEPEETIDDQLKSLLLEQYNDCLLYTSPSPRDRPTSRMPSSSSIILSA